LATKGSQLKKNIQNEIKTISKSREFANKMDEKFEEIINTAREEDSILKVTGHSNVCDLAKDLFEIFALSELLCDQQ